MKPKLKKSKQYTLGSGRLPKSLVERLYRTPQYFNPEKHPLSPYLKKQIIPEPGLDILLLQNFEDYCYELYRYQHVEGLYISALKYGMRGKGLNDLALDTLRKDYGITTTRAILFPNEKIEYGVLIHELLHDVFNNLQNADRKKILNAAKADYIKKRQSGFSSQVLLIDFGSPAYDDLYKINEFIAYLFYYKINFSLRGYSFSKSNPLPERFGKTLRDVGYKV